MTNQWLRPYAAKGIIEHEFDTDHLNIWITFRHPMDQTVKPTNNLWICEVDDVEEAVTDSAWQDEFTMLLTVDAIGSIPDRVTLEYDGPDENLKTTWAKQWEPWGQILSTDSSLLPYGCFHGIDITFAQVAAVDTWYIISDANFVAHHEHKMSFQNEQELKITVAGIYSISYYLSVESNAAQKHLHAGILVNAAVKNAGQAHYHFGRANEEITLSATAIVTLAVNDVVGFGFSTPDGGNPTLTAHNGGITIIEIGKT